MLAVTVLVVSLLFETRTSLGWTQGPAPGDRKEKADKDSDEPSAIRRAAEQLVDTIELEVLADDKWSKVKRLKRPLLLYTDDTRYNDRGSVWTWCDKGRPLALFEMFQKVDDRTIWVVGICNTSGRKLRASRMGTPWWLENDSDIEFKDIPSAPRVAADSTVRQRQLKLLARKFTAHEIYNPKNTRYDLRLLERPLHTYRDEPDGVVEGGLFTFANGTNPEIMLFIEARTDPHDKSNRVWQYGVGRTSYAELHLEYDGKGVFTAPRGNVVSGRNRPFWTSVLPSAIR
jgi:hypothetical protein